MLDDLGLVGRGLVAERLTFHHHSNGILSVLEAVDRDEECRVQLVLGEEDPVLATRLHLVASREGRVGVGRRRQQVGIALNNSNEESYLFDIGEGV